MLILGLVGTGSICWPGNMMVVDFGGLMAGGVGSFEFRWVWGGWSLVVVRCEAVLMPCHTEPRSCEGLDLSNFFTSPNCHMTMCC